MKLTELKKALNHLQDVNFELPNGKMVPAHFHVTEVGKVTKNFIDCGGTVRSEEVVSLQLWESIDFYHRLKPEKLLKVIDLSQKTLKIEDGKIEVEYQGETIGKYGLSFVDGKFKLTNKTTACLASDACGIVDKVKQKVKLSEIKNTAASCCDPSSGCC